jgi:2-polyprenyl-6-methoxyphenol hydroxylase-like FAD-dependent oxidoreductase
VWRAAAISAHTRGVRVVVIGGSAAGLFTALVLARTGHEVTVVERDDLTPVDDLEAAAAAAYRVTAPQIVQPHVVLATCRELLRERLPDVYEALLAAGVVEAPLVSQMPPTVTEHSPAPGDERLALLMTRRVTVDWVLGRIAAAEPAIEVRYGEQVTGLLVEPGDAPRVGGIRTERGALTADLVVDTTGRRSPVDRWLAAIGARPTSMTRAECGVAYFSRHYRLCADELPGPAVTRVVAALDEFTVGIWGGDNRTMQLALAPLAIDRRFRSARRPDVFTAVMRTIPYYAAWIDALEPITDVYVMGGLHNTLRRLVVDGRPVVTGLHAVGDSVCTTNPTFGRGLSSTLRNAADLADVLTAHPGDPHAQALAMDRAVTDHIAPWFADQATTDAARLAMLRHTVLGAAAPAPPVPAVDRIGFGELRAAAQVDPVAFRAFWRIMGMVGTPSDVYSDAAVVARVRDVLAHGVPAPMPQPSHAELEAALAM